MREQNSMFFKVLACGVFLALAAGGCRTSGQMGKDVLAVVEGDPITVLDLKVANGGTLPARDEKEEALDKLINRKLVARLALEKGLLGDPGVNSRIEEFYTEELPEFWKKKMAEEAAVTDEDFAGFRGRLQPIFDVSMIALPTVEAAEEALAQIRKGVKFNEVAAKQSSLKGGTEKEVALDDELYPAGVRAVLKGMKPGDVSTAMKMDVGYVIFRLNKRKESDELWKEREESYRAMVKTRKAEERMNELLDKLRDTAKVEPKSRVLPNGEVQYMGVVVDGTSIDLDPELFSPGKSPHVPHQSLNTDTIKAALNKMVNDFILAREARRQGVQNDPEFQRALKLAKEEYLADAYLELVRGEYQVTDQDVEEYFNKNKEKYIQPPTVRLGRILARTKSDADAALAELKKGKDFAAVAKERSVDPDTKDKGGDAGYLPTEGLRPPLKEAVLKLRKGEISGIIKDEYGFEILKLLDGREGGAPDISEVSDSIKKRVLLVKQGERVEAFYKELSAKSKVKVNKELLKSL